MMSRAHKKFAYNSMDQTQDIVASLQLIEPFNQILGYGVKVEMNEKKRRVTIKLKDRERTVRSITLSEGVLIQLARKLFEA